MSKKMLLALSLMATAGLVLAACGSATPAEVQVTVPVPVNQTVIVTPTSGAATATSLPAGSVKINAAGATFPLPVYSAWTYAFQYVDPAVVINYQGIGSGGGKKAIIDGTVDFAGSDSLLADTEYTAGKDLQMYPMLAGAVVVTYNIKWNTIKGAAVGAGTPTPTATPIPTLVLNRQTLVDIYNAKITKWNDPEIMADNSGLKDLLPNATITAVHRSDGSGTTEIFTKALTSFSADWTAGGASSVQWPVDKAGNGLGGKGNQGVAAAVLNSPNSLGYVELSYAISNSMPFVTLINKAGQKVVANSASVNSAMSDFAGAFTPKLTATIVDGSGAGSWPITGYTYIILHTTSMPDCVKAQKILEFLHWALTDPAAAKQASNLGYSVLPDAVRTAVLAKLGEVTCNGKAVPQ